MKTPPDNLSIHKQQLRDRFGIGRLVSCGLLLALIANAGCSEDDNPMVHRHRAMLAEQRGDTEQALQVRANFIERFPDYYFMNEVYFEQGMTLLDQERYAESLTFFDRAIEDDPNYLDAYIRRCQVNQILGHQEQAIQDGNRAIELSVANEDLAIALFHQGNAQRQLNYPARAVVRWQMAILLDPDHQAALRALFREHMEQGDYESALQLMENSLAREANQPEKQLLYSQVLVHLNRMDEAKVALERARELNTNKDLFIPESIEQTPRFAIAEQAPVVHTAARPAFQELTAEQLAGQAAQVGLSYLATQGFDTETKRVADFTILVSKRSDDPVEILVKQIPEQQTTFSITAAEVDFIASARPPRGLILISEIKADPLTGEILPESGKVIAYSPSWLPDQQKLQPQTFRYELPGRK